MRHVDQQTLDLVDLLSDDSFWFKNISSVNETEEIKEWTEDEIIHIYDALLEDALRNLADSRCSSKTTMEIYKWMNNKNDKNPFSFENCCRVNGFDPDVIKSSVFDRINKKAKLH